MRAPGAEMVSDMVKFHIRDVGQMLRQRPACEKRHRQDLLVSSAHATGKKRDDEEEKGRR